MLENGNKNLNSLKNNTNLNQSHEVALYKTIYELRIILVGDSGVGKTSLVNRFMGNDFQENNECTINVDFKIKTISSSSSIGAELKIFDTCGQEKYISTTRQYFKGTHGIVLVFDVCDLQSFKNLSNWMKEIKNNSDINPEIILVANKIDLEDRKVSKETGKKFADKNNIMYVETSCKKGINIDSPFEKLANAWVNKIKENPDNYINNTIINIKNYGEKDIEKIREKDVKCC